MSAQSIAVTGSPVTGALRWGGEWPERPEVGKVLWQRGVDSEAGGRAKRLG
jgi:hypothetical protein